MIWTRGAHYEGYQAGNEKLAMAFPGGDGEHWWWVVFDETQQSLIGSGCDDELKDAQYNAEQCLLAAEEGRDNED